MGSHAGTSTNRPGQHMASMKSKDQVVEELNRRLHHYSAVGYDESLNPYHSPSKLPVALPTLPVLEKENKDKKPTTDRAMSKLPVSERRQRKRSALTKRKGGVTLSGLQPVSISKYRPDYTWNRGGRVKELRIRNLGRKFLHIWMAKVYGRVNPTVARVHYNQRQLRRAYSAWREVWWTNVREWRLMVRAECQQRYVLWNRVFKAWRLFVQQEKLQHNKEAAAQNIANRRLLAKILFAWKEHHHNKQAKEGKKACALRFNEENIVRKAWSVWREKVMTRRRHQQMEAVAMQFWAYRTQIQHWLLWRQVFQDHVTERVRLQQATRLYHSGLRSRCLHAMLAYVEVRKFKNKRKDFARQVHTSSALVRFFSRWCDSLRLRRSLAEHQHRMIQLARRCSMRKALTLWKNYVAGKQSDRKKREIADVHYLKHLLMMGVSGLRLGVVRRGIKDTRQIMAEDFHRNQRLKQCWCRWVERCEEIEEMQTLALSQQARHHHRAVILSRCFEALVRYKNKKQQKQAFILKADAFFYWKSLPKYFFKMRVFVQIMQNKQEDQQKAKAFRRENLLARFFYHWFVESEKSQNCRMAERMAILHYNGRLGLRFLLLWKRKTTEIYELREKEAIAAGHHNQMLFRNTLKQWKYIVEEQKISRNHELKASRHRYIQQVKKALQAWKKFHEQRLGKRKGMQTALSHYQHRHCLQAMDIWKQFVIQQQQRTALAENMYQEKCAVLKRWALRKWHDNVNSLMEEKECEQKASLYRNQYLLAKVVKTWHRFAAIHAYKKSETRQLVEEGRRAIESGIVRRVFQRWRDARDQSLVSRLKYEQAVQHWQTSVRIRAVKAWREHAKLSLRKKLLSRQACWFRQTMVQSQCWLRWRYEYSQALESHSQINLALWHWSLSLQRSMLVRWWEYVQSRKQKKLRYAEALERRRSTLLKSGVTQWLKVAGEFTQMRARFAAQKHTKSAYDSFQLVQKYALHWMQVTAKRKVGRQPFTLPASGGRQIPVEVAKKTVSMVPTVSFSPVRLTSHVGSRPLPVPQEPNSVCVSEPIRAVRPRPRRPDFLIASLKRDGLLSASLEQCTVLDRSPVTRNTTNEAPAAVRDTLDEAGCVTCEQIPHVRTESVVWSASSGSRPPVTNSSMQLGNFPTDKLQNAEAPCDTEEPEENHTVKVGEVLGRTSLIQARSCGTVTEACKPSVPVAEKLASFIPDENVRPMEPSGHTQNNLDCGSSKPTLLTPETFLTRKDGTLIAESQDIVGKDSKVSLSVADNACSVDMELELDTSDREVVERPEAVLIFKPEDASQRQSEIIQIRDRLKMFDQKKKNLKELKGQWKQLSLWLSGQSCTEDSRDDMDSVRQEIQQMEEEMLSLKAEISQEKPGCAQLVDRVHYLIQLQKHVTGHNSSV